MKKYILALAAAAFALCSNAAKISFSTSEILTYTEDTENGSIDITFQKCMQNKLFTFYIVKLNGVTVNSAATSDNIGPFYAGGAWMGGNHNTPQGGSKPSAYTRSVSVEVDGTTLAQGASKEGDVMIINVMNEIYYTDDQKFADENVTYRVSGNSIEVWCEHTFQYPAAMNVSRYYGPQSMFPATELLLPGTAEKKWKSLTGVKEVDVMKSDYPEFSTYIERNANGYQAVYKYNDGIGDASCVSTGGEVYLFRNYGGATGKSYHVMMWDHKVKAGDQTKWHALYSWFDTPIQDTFATEDESPVFEYGATINGKDVVMSYNTDGYIAGIEDIIINDSADFAQACDGRIIIAESAPKARCYTVAGRLVHTGAGSFDCAPGIYIVNDMQGNSVKLVVK